MRCNPGKPLNIIRSLRFPEDITRVNWNNESGRGNADNQSNPGCPSKPVNSLDRARHFIVFPQDPGTCADPVLLSCGAGRSVRQKQEERERERERSVTAANCVYSCTASNIHQMPSLQSVMWSNQHFTACQMMSKPLATWQCQKEKKNLKHIHTYTHKHTSRFSFLVHTTDRRSKLIC